MDRYSTTPQGSLGLAGGRARPTEPKRSFASRLFGYDIFLSFALGPPPRGTHSYASDLARRLRERDFSVFFSEDEAPPGEQLDSTLRSALLRSKNLVVIVNRGTLQEPRWVRKEVEEFRKQRPNRPVIPIDVGGTLQDSMVAESAQEWLGYQGKIWLDESIEAVNTGIASDRVLDRLATAPTRTKSNVKWRWIVRGVTAMLAALTIGLGIATKTAIDNANEARRQQRTAVSRQVSVQAIGELREGRSDLALLLSMEANRIHPSFEARHSLLKALEQEPRLRGFLQGHRAGIKSLVFSPDGSELLSADEEGNISLWNVAGNRQIGQPITVHPRSVDRMLFEGSGHLVTAVTDLGTIILEKTDLKINTEVNIEDVKSEIVKALSPNGLTLACLSGDNLQRNVVILRDRATRHPLGRPITINTYQVTDIVFTPDSARLASVDWSGDVKIWEVANQKWIGPSFVRHDDALELETESPYRLSVSPDGKTLASFSGDRTIVLWDIESHRQRGNRISQAADVSSLIFSPDSKTLVCGGDDGTITYWDVKTHQLVGPSLRGSGGTVTSLAFTQDGTMLSAGTDNGKITLWDMRRQPAVTGELFPGNCVAFRPDGAILSIGESDRTISLREMGSGKTISPYLNPVGPTPPFREGTVHTLAFSHDGKRLASADYTGAIIIWDMDTRQQLGQPLIADRLGAGTLAFSPDNNLLLSAHHSGAIWLWDVGSKQLAGPKIISRRAYRVACSQDGRILAFSSLPDETNQDWTIKLWDIVGHQPIGEFRVGQMRLNSLAFSPNGKTIALGSNNGISIWDVESRTPLNPPMEGGIVDKIAFTPDGTTIAAYGGEGITLWDIASRQPYGYVPTNNHGWRSMDFSPDGKILALCSAAETVLLWKMDLESWQARACRLANRNLTSHEWRRYLGDAPYRATCSDIVELEIVGKEHKRHDGSR